MSWPPRTSYASLGANLAHWNEQPTVCPEIDSIACSGEAAGQPDEAVEAARAALAAYERKGHEPGAASARALIEEISAG
jgi:hypothetical protein